MAELGSRGRATDDTSDINIKEILREKGGEGLLPSQAVDTSRALRKELESKGLKGFKKGGKVKKTGVYKLHAGEKVVTAKKAAQESRDKKLLQKTRYR